ncbi:hypothetical protein [Streptomyces omiyaensis]|uniref:Integral membrane protein n=1 Tax=Streptomyces omiyaensis TaxID=68247 RepID=A0ABW7BZC7_9ACTN|nr:hypothetical protein [Streptomyces omiyaensis]GGY68510.1 hypothetical protein GCM10010363_57290 [Streptomyces omiyaensis]
MVRRRVPLVTLTLIAVGLVAGGLWWWAVLRLLLFPGESGPVEGAVAAGGWGLSLLPVHVAASSRPVLLTRDRVTRAWRRRRSDAGSAPS